MLNFLSREKKFEYKKDSLHVIYYWNQQLTVHVPQTASKNCSQILKYLKCFAEWPDVYHKIEFATGSLMEYVLKAANLQCNVGISLGSRKK